MTKALLVAGVGMVTALGGTTAETIADRLITALDEAAEREPDPERKGWLRKSAAYLGNAGRDLAVEIGATAINRQMGM